MSLEKSQSAAELYDQGNQELAHGEFHSACAAFSSALGKDPSVAAYYLGRGVARAHLDDLGGALEDLEQAVALQPDFAAAHARVGVLRSAVGDVRGAIEALGQALQLDPQDADSNYNRGLLLKQVGDHARAKDDYERWRNLIGDDPT